MARGVEGGGQRGVMVFGGPRGLDGEIVVYNVAGQIDFGFLQGRSSRHAGLLLNSCAAA